MCCLRFNRYRRLTNKPRTELRTYVVVPVNVPRLAKTRLKSVLNTRQRERLTQLMFGRVMEAALHARRCDGVYVTSPDLGVLAAAKTMGAKVIHERGRRNLNHALRNVLSKIHLDHDVVTAAVVHADIPLVTARDIDDFLQTGGGYPVVIAPSGDGLGTNALSLSPPTVLAPRFGPHSFRVHLQAARSAGLTVSIFRRDGLSFDVDRPRDLSLLVRRSRTRPQLAKEVGEILRVTSRM